MRQFKIFIMLSKSKLYISVLILAISLGVIPIGASINTYLRDQVSAEIPDTILKIKGEVVPEIESDYLGLGVPRVLEGVREKLVLEISDDIVLVEAIPQTLLSLQNRTIDLLPLMINSSVAASKMYDVMYNITVFFTRTWNYARDQFFNDINFQANFSSYFNSTIEGVSEHMTGGTTSLDYSQITRDRLLLGYTLEGTDYPGLLIDRTVTQVGEAGIGFVKWLELYSEAEGDNATRALMETVYDCSWSSGQLQNLSAYIKTYLWPNIVKKQYEPLDLETYADIVFYRQWANKTDFPSGLPLEYIVNELEDKLKSAAAVDIIDTNFQDLLTQTGNNLTLARHLFFNDCNITGNYGTDIRGVSEQIFRPTVCNATYSLNYTSIAQERLLDGYESYPGILEQPSVGIGLIQWINLYNLAVGDLPTQTDMEINYNASWTEQIVPFADYLLDYIYQDLVETVGQKGLETDLPSQYAISNSTTRDLWDTDNPYSIVNESGIKKWFAAYNGNITVQNELNATFEMDEYLIYNTTNSRFYRWLFRRFRLNLVPIFFTFLDFQGDNITPLEYADILSFQQWANGTLDSSGFNLGSGIKGFEVGVPIPSNISFTIATAFFDETNKSAFANGDGVLKWIEAYQENLTVQAELIAVFQIDNTTLGMITDWLFNQSDGFRWIVVPNLVEIVTIDPYKCNPYTGGCDSYTLTELAVLEFYRQWANGTLSRQTQWKDGLEPFWHNQTGLESIAGWEVGLPHPTNIDKFTVEKLWTPTTIWDFFRPTLPNPLSFVTPTGFPMWFKAIETSSTYKYLRDEFGLNNDQMDAILDWFLFIREGFALDILQEESGLPISHYELGNIYFMSFTITGIVLVAISALLVAWIKLYKRK